MTAQAELFPSVLDRNPRLGAYLAKHPAAYEEFYRETLVALREPGARAGELSAKFVAERCRSRTKGGIDNRFVTLLSRLVEERLGTEVFRKRRRRVE